jgi:hypothetical protein
MTSDSKSSNNEQSSHEPLVDRAVMGLDLAAEHHLANCPCCQSDREGIERALKHFAEVQREQAKGTENFWERQAAKIREAAAESARPSLALRSIPALAAAALAAFLLLQPSSKPTPPPAPAMPSDEAVLSEVERAMASGTPAALEPVSLYSAADTDEMSPSKSSAKKEPANHVE